MLVSSMGKVVMLQNIGYDTVSDVVESGVQWRSNFQIGSRVLKIVINLFLCISMAYNVISCIKVAEITQTLKIADFTM